MNWFRRLFSRNGQEIITTNVPLTTLTRWYIYDTGFGDENEIAHLLGLTPVSEEGNKKERQDSDKRVGAIHELLPYVDFISSVAGDAIANLQCQEMKKAGLIPDDRVLEDDMETMRGVYRAIAVAALVGGFSIANHLGIVSINAESSDIIPAEDDYYD